MRRDLVVTALCLLALALSVPAFAEVRVVTDRDGEYVMTRVLVGRTGQVWSPLRDASPIRALNITGDRKGDLWPKIAESSLEPHYPWVVWSRWDEADLDLAWSRWTGSSWDPVLWLADQEVGEQWDDLDADMSFGDDGRPYIVWWRNEGGVGRIYVSMFLNTSWMDPYPVSIAGVDSRYPTIEVQESNKLVVWFETAEGLMEQTVLFYGGIAITDDINPLDVVYTEGVPVKINY